MENLKQAGMDNAGLLAFTHANPTSQHPVSQQPAASPPATHPPPPDAAPHTSQKQSIGYPATTS
jgi:hypothetical protein